MFEGRVTRMRENFEIPEREGCERSWVACRISGVF